MATLTPPDHSFTILDQCRPPESLLGESQHSSLTLMSSIPMNTIQSDTVLVRRHHECGYTLHLSLRGHIQVQQTFIQDQTILYSKEHVSLAFHIPSQQLVEQSVSLWRWYLPTCSEPLFACSQHGVRVLQLCPVHHVHRSQLHSLKACLLPSHLCSFLKASLAWALHLLEAPMTAPSIRDFMIPWSCQMGTQLNASATPFSDPF